MESRIHRFDFSALRDFRGPVAMRAPVPDAVEAVAPPPPPAPVFSETDLELARLSGKKEGYSEGFTAGQHDAKKQADQRTEDSNLVIAALSETLRDLDARYRQMLEHESRYLSALVLASARKVAGEAINERSEATVAAIIARCMPVMFSKPRLIIELHPDAHERTQERIASQLRADGYEGDVQFKPNPAMGLSDVHLDWGSGQLTHSAENLWSEIETLIERVPLELTFAETLNTTNAITGE